MRFIIIIILLSFGSVLKAQYWSWNDTIIDPVNKIYPFDVALDTEGNLYSLCSYKSTITLNDTDLNSTDKLKMLLVKYNPEGNKLWGKLMESGGLQENTVKGTPTLATDKFNNIYVLSEFIDTMVIGNDTLISPTIPVETCPDSCVRVVDPPIDWVCDCPDTIREFVSSPYIVKFSPEGKYLMLKQITKSINVQIKNLHIDNNLNIYLTGMFSDTIELDSEKLIAKNKSGYLANMFMVKYDSEGKIIWASSKGDSKNSMNLIADCDENVYITGKCGTDAMFDDKKVKEAGAFAAKFDSIGNCIWATHTTHPYAAGYGLGLDKSGNCYVGGTFGFIFVTKLDQNGTIKWEVEIESEKSNSIYDFKTDNDGNSFFTGMIKGTTVFGADSIVTASPDEIDAYVASLDSTGKFNWIEHQNIPGLNEGYSIDLGKNNDVAYIGMCIAKSKLAVNVGAISAPLSNKNICSTPSVNNITEDKLLNTSDFYVFPNPSKEVFSVVIQKKYIDFNVKIFNISGQLIPYQILSYENKIDIEFDAPKGLYFLEISSGNKILETIKLIKN